MYVHIKEQKQVRCIEK